MYMAPGQTQVMVDPQTGCHFKVSCVGNGVDYVIENLLDGSRQIVDNNIVHAIFHNNGNLASVGIQFQTMSLEDKQELEELEKELKSWERFKKLELFQNLPCDMRQDVVNESKAKDLESNMDNIDTSDFDSIKRLNELRCMEYPRIHAGHMGMHFNLNQVKWRYQKLLDEYTTQELEEAHATATLEEELASD